MGFSRIARFLVAGAVVAGVAPLSPAPAQAANCDATVVVFTQTSVDLPEGVKNPRNGQDNLANPTLDSRGFGCTLSPDFEANTSFIYPGSTIIASRNLAGAASTYCFDGSLMGFRCGGVVVYSDIVNGNAYESEELALDPTALGCTLAFFDGSRGAGSEYCTLTHLQP